MPVIREQSFPVHATEDIVRVRHWVRDWASQNRFSLVDQTKLITAASELARNMVVYGGGGEMKLENLNDDARTGLRIHFVDHGPGIPDVQLALRDGYTTGTGLGLGLGGAKRLSNEFEIESKPGAGTRVTITRWR
jgi:serine/threonine-protein kinase RsbT